MRNVISAESTKLLPHKGTWFLVWLYPIVVTAILLIAIIVKLANGGSAAAPVVPIPDAAATMGWIQDTSFIWYVPGSTFGRYLIAAFFGIVFAGEYGWNTWKLVVPHAPRWQLIGAKYAVALGLLCTAWLVTAVIAVLLAYVKSAVVGEAIPQGVTPGAIVHAHILLLREGIVPLLLTAGYASLLAVLTRSTLAAFLLSLVLITIDEFLGKIVLGLSAFGMEWASVLYRVLPSYHLDNFAGWLHGAPPLRLPLMSGAVIEYAPMTSLMVLTAWIAGLVGLTFWVFRRQDIN